jgi:hypothetical protein
MTPLAAVSDFGSRRYHRFVPFNFLLSGDRRYHQFVPICRNNRPLSSIQLIIGKKFIGSVVDTGEQFIGGVLTPANNLSEVS